MTGGINPEAAQPSSTQAFEQSDRNPVVAELGGPEANGGQWPAPSAADSRVTHFSGCRADELRHRGQCGRC